MLDIVSCLSDRHSPIGIALAAGLCVASALAAALLPRAGAGRARRSLLAGATLGGGAWATHFVAMLAYDAGTPTAYALIPTLLSALLGVLGGAAAFAVWFPAARGTAWRRPLAGAILGLSIGAMHYLGMTALAIGGHVTFDPLPVAASILLVLLLSALALDRLRPVAGPGRRIAAAALLTLAVLSLHFTGMAAVRVWLDPAVAVPATAMPRPLLAALVVTVSAVVLAAGLSVLAIEARIGAAAQRAEADRLRNLADAASEALAMVDERGRITDASSRFAALVGEPRSGLIGREIAALLREEGRDAAGEARAVLSSGVPVELRRREMQTGSGTRTVVAVRDLRERIESEDRIRHLAHHDVLTGLGNRAQMMQRLEEERARADRAGTGFALLCLDLDRFKPVNDIHGHAAGDRVLQQVADRLRDAVRESDFCARLGGDEFVVVQASPAQPESAQALAARLVALLSETFDHGDGEASLSASIGIALYPTDGASGGELLRAADVALYRVKESGRGGFAFFQAEMDRDLRLRRDLERDVRLACPRGQLSLVWQPQADTDTGTITGFEVLLRWRHPERGIVPPDVFIPVAEASGAIVPIGGWVLGAACREAATWSSPLRVAVNVSALQIQQPDFPAQVAAILAETGLEAGRLELEVTETLLISDTERALATLRAVKALGVRLSLDDFGTGYSSLGTLRSFPFDKLKIDRSFVQQMIDDAQSGDMVQAILGLSRAMNLPVVAEGVETEAQRALLGTAACEEVQGYLIGRPQPIEAFDALLGGRRVQAA